MTGTQPTTGLTSLDSVLKTLLPGDNLVWQIDSVADYAPFVEPCCTAAIAAGKQVIYFRFAEHEPLLHEGPGIEIQRLYPERGFEKVVRDIHVAIQEAGSLGVYVFDCLSDLVATWYSDHMLGNFFRLICPYVYDVEGLAYFPLRRNVHSPQAYKTITDTTQILIDVYQHKGRRYIHPLKVQQRHSPTMYMLHACNGTSIAPVTESSTIAEIMNGEAHVGTQATRAHAGIWDRTFFQAEQAMKLVAQGKIDPHQKRELVRHLLCMAVTREERMLALVEKYLDLPDILRIWQRMIGTGLIGGKSVGMLLSRAILKHDNPQWNDRLEEHDSFYVGSDVFYTYLVRNGCWWLREKQRNPATFLDGAEEARRRILLGTFAPETQQQFSNMLDYFGQCPIIVRSSSLLEDAFGNSFAGKYDSVFCVNQGSRDKRLEDFMSAVRTIYASAMSEKALRYRARRGLLEGDEQMSLLVQRVSGSLNGQLFYPQAAGVGLSFNPYVWDEQIDPKAGVIRLVFGLGTRAVNRSDDDYTRVVALNVPEKSPEAGSARGRQYAQRNVDVLDLASNQLVSLDFAVVGSRCPASQLDMFASVDEELQRYISDTGKRDIFPYVLTFEQLLSKTPVVDDFRDMLTRLQNAYGCPVDVEFTLNFFQENVHKINLVQCRPLQIASEKMMVEAAPNIIPLSELVFESVGVVVGQSRDEQVDRMLYVVPSVYGKLPMSDRYAVARLIGRIIHLESSRGHKNVMLLGPGRWGTTTPSLGIPVSYAEVNKASFICEIACMHETLIPDVSLGTHFFNEMVEADTLYLAIFPGREGNQLNEDFLTAMPNRLADLVPEAARRANVLHVIDATDLPAGKIIRLNANNQKQKVICYLR